MPVFTHLDADAFFASVEQAADPRLRGKPVAVGGEKRGIIASASYEARKLGIYTPMPTVRARRLCPRLIVLPGDFEKYERFSRWMFSYAYDFTPEVEINSIDEGYFDLTGAGRSPVEIARTIRDAIRQALKITVSEGIGSSKLVSQIASKYRKPAALEYVPPGAEIPFLHPLPNRWLPGIGPKTALRFNAAGLTHIQHIAHTPLERLFLLVGNAAPQLRAFAQGLDDRPIVPVSAPAKSYSQQETFEKDQTDEAFLEDVLRRMADRLFAGVRADGKCIRTLTVKVRYNDRDEDQCSESLGEPTDLETDVYGRLHTLLRRAWKRRVSLRLVSLKLSNLYNDLRGAELALDRAAQQHEARRRLASTLDALREEHGHYSVMRGHDLELRNAERGAGQAEGEMPRRPAPPLPLLHIRARRIPQSLAGTNPNDAPARPEPGRTAGDLCSALRVSRSVPEGVPLCVRSHYSFLNSTLSPEDIVALAGRHGWTSVALCDQGNLHGAPAFAAAARAAGIRPVLGVELEVNGQPLRLYVENGTGYGNLCRLLSQRPSSAVRRPEEAWSEHESTCVEPLNRTNPLTRPIGHPLPGGEGWGEGEPRFRERDGVRTSHGSGEGTDPFFRSLGFGSGTALPLDGLIAVASDAVLAPLFPGRFYLGVSHPDELRRLRHPDRLPVVALHPVHYATPADRWQWDVLQSIRTLTLLRQEHPEKQLGGDFHFRPPGELADRFRDHPGLLNGAREIAERCAGFEFPFGKPQFPAFQTPDGSSAREFLRGLVQRGCEARYGGSRPASHVLRADRSRIREQVETELQIIREVGYEDYFLIVWDLLRECRARGIDWITRGSAADSLVCYCLGISSVCPVRFDLYFRRFLNPERMALNKLPDIDIDFPHDRKDDVVDLLFQRYGVEHCAVVGGFSTFQARSAFAEVAKVLGVAEREVRRWTEHFPWGIPQGPGGASGTAGQSNIAVQPAPPSASSPRPSILAEQLRQRPETAGLPLDEEPYRSALCLAEFLDGRPRYPKMHPCGVVLSRQPIHELTPTFVSQKGWSTTQFDMDAVEAIGLVKMDILAQGGLAVMRDVRTELAGRGLAVDLERFEEIGDGTRPRLSSSSAPGDPSPKSEVRSPKELRIPPSAIRHPPFNDPEVWNLIASGNARAVHHIESPAMISLCRMTHVRDIDTLIAIVSVIRPGAANEDKKREFTRRAQGLSPITYAHPVLEPCLRGTFGLVVYEEHILQICEAFAGLGGGRADVLRRALVKENWPVVRAMEQEFRVSAGKRGRSAEDIARVWELVIGFHGYAFCKAHSTAYAVEAYQSAWLKRHFPAEFMAAVLTHGKGFYRPLVYVLECWRLGIGMLPPRLNEPGPDFAVVRQEDRAKSDFGLRTSDFGLRTFLRPPLTSIASLTAQTRTRLLAERRRGEFRSLADFYRRVQPGREELENLSRAGALDEFGRTRCEQFWEIQQLIARGGGCVEAGQGELFEARGMGKAECGMGEWNAVEGEGGRERGHRMADEDGSRIPSSPLPAPRLAEPSRLQRLQWEVELLGFPVSGHPLELYPDIAWDTYCPVARLGAFVGQEVTLCGLVVEDRVHQQVTGEPMKFLTLCDWTGLVETELFAATYKSQGLATVRYPVLEVTGRVEAFQNGRGHTLRVLRAGQPRIRSVPQR
jgi:DNA-directed DNA polymerase III PolC